MREFRGRKFLSTSIDKTSEIQLIEDIGEVTDEDCGDGVAAQLCEKRVHDVRIVGVKHLDKYQPYLICSTN